jgi:hypothetical protein
MQELDQKYNDNAEGFFSGIAFGKFIREAP